jgi:hypothetical protein
MPKPNPAPTHQDLVTYTAPPVKVIRDSEVINLFYIPNYYVIIIALRQGPMTVRDLEQAFKERAKKHKGLQARSDKSIYRYLKELENAGLVVPAGQRVVSGKMVTETLFARTGQIFLLFRTKPDWWLSKEGAAVAKRIGRLLTFLLDGEMPPIRDLQNLLMQFEESRQSHLEHLAAQGDKQVLETLASSTLLEHFRIEDAVGYFSTFILQPEFLEQLRKIMKLKK